MDMTLWILAGVAVLVILPIAVFIALCMFYWFLQAFVDLWRRMVEDK